MVSQATPIHVERRVIIQMHKLMHEGVFHMFLIEEVSLAKHNCASFGREATRTGEVAGHARHVGRVAVHPSEVEMFEHKLYRWTCIQYHRERTKKKIAMREKHDVL
jgi:hypothetical protein